MLPSRTEYVLEERMELVMRIQHETIFQRRLMKNFQVVPEAKPPMGLEVKFGKMTEEMFEKLLVVKEEKPEMDPVGRVEN